MWRPWELSSSASVRVCADKNRRKHLSLDAKVIVKNVYESMLKRGYSQLDALRETASLTNVPLSTVRSITCKPLHTRKKPRHVGKMACLDESQKDLIRRKIYQMYQEQIVPTLDSLKLRLLQDDTDINCSRTSLWRALSHLGFKYCTIDKRKVIMESARLRRMRYDYLQEIKKYRSENRPIIYLDETWFDTHDSVKKGWSDTSKQCMTNACHNRGKRITILHAGSETGFVPNALLLSAKSIKDSSLDYHEDTTAELFENWFKNTLLSNIPNNSVIVMDNASYHSRLIKKVPTASNTKSEIKEFLYTHDMYFEEYYSKNDLLSVLKSFNMAKEYVCDNMAKEMGHKVLRLPPYYCVFNPIEHIWHQLKSKVRAENTSPTLSASVIQLIRKVVDEIPVESWKNSVNHVIKVEDSYIYVNNEIKPLIINLNDESDSETELNW